MTTITSSFRNTLGGVALVAASVAVQAAPIDFNAQQSGLNISNSETFNLQTSYNPTTDTLNSLQLTLNFESGHNNANNNSWFDKSFAVNFGDVNLSGQTAASVTLTNTAFNIDTSQYISAAGVFSFTVEDLHTHARLTGYNLNISGVRSAEQTPTNPPSDAVPVPAPSTLALLSLGVLGAGLFGRRRSKAANS